MTVQRIADQAFFKMFDLIGKCQRGCNRFCQIKAAFEQSLESVFGAADKQNIAFREVLEFTHIARPFMFFKLPDQGWCRSVVGAFKPFSGTFGKNIKQKGNVIGAITQRGDCQFKRIDAKHQIFAKLAGGNRVGQVFVGGTNQAKIDFNR